jgi:hypothetical protein
VPESKPELGTAEERIRRWWRKRGFLEHQIERIYREQLVDEAVYKARIAARKGKRNG